MLPPMDSKGPTALSIAQILCFVMLSLNGVAGFMGSTIRE